MSVLHAVGVDTLSDNQFLSIASSKFTKTEMCFTEKPCTYFFLREHVNNMFVFNLYIKKKLFLWNLTTDLIES